MDLSKEDFELGLRRWGFIYGERPERELAESSRAPAVHPIARAMEFAQRGMERRLGDAWKRAIRPGERAWSRDPITCAETRSAPGSAPINTQGPAHDLANVIQSVWLELRRKDAELAEVLRLEYQVREQQAEKAKALGIGRGKFRELLAEAKGWVFAKVTEPVRAIA